MQWGVLMRWVSRIAIAVVAVPLLLVLLMLVALNIGAGRLALEAAVNRLTPARIEGLSGRFPDRLRLAHLTVVDPKGPWLDARDIAIDWTPSRLLSRWASVQSLSARELTLSRLPASDAAASSPASGGPPTLPIRVQIEALSVPTLRVDAAVAGIATTVAVEGQVDLLSLKSGTGALTLTGIDRPGRYALTVSAKPDLALRLSLDEPAGGPLAQLAGLPSGAIGALATLDGPADAAALVADATVGPLTAHVAGTLNIPGQAVDGTVRVTAPSMTLAGVGWDGAMLDATVRGPWAKPGGTARLRVAAVRATGVTLRSLTADATAPNPGQVTLDATLDGLTLAAAPGLFDGAPVHAIIAAELTGSRPVRFSVDHPVLTLAGEAQTAGTLSGTATLILPALDRLATLAGVALQGRADLKLQGAQVQDGPTRATVDGTVAITSGAPYTALLGPAATIGLTVEQTGDRIALPRLMLDGRTLQMAGSGSLDQGAIDATVRATLTALGVVAPGWTGAMTVDATAHGPTDAFAVQARAQGTVGAPGQPAGPITATIDATGLPGAPAGQVTADGTLAGSPLHVQAAIARKGADTTVTIDRATWKSVRAAGMLQLTPKREGSATMEIGSLADLAVLGRGPRASGRAEARVTLTPDAARIDATVQGLAAQGLSVGRAELQGRVTGLDRPVLAATLTLDGVAAGTIGGRARIEANGPATNLAVHAAGSGQAAGAPASFDVRASVDPQGKIVRLTEAQATARGDTLRLVAPATLRLADGIVVDRLRLTARAAELDIAGRLGPTLDATARLRASGAALALVPGLLGQGSISLDAAVTGTTAAPRGTVRLQATGLRADAAPEVPPLTLNGTAQLTGDGAQVDARAQAGSAMLTAAGRVPIGAGPLDVRVAGALDLTLLNPILGAQGRRATGRLTLDGRVGGTLAAPTPTGTATLAGASIDDFAQGLRISGIAGTVRADGDVARITSLVGHAGPGTITVNGTAGLGGALPLDLTIRLRDARPLASDRITADLDGDVTVRGPAAGPSIAGTVTVRTAELRVPDSLPASVATLNARRPGDRPPPPAAPASPIALDLRIVAPGAVFVRGRGLDAEVGGSLLIQGTAAVPAVTGGLMLRRGTLNVAGTVLTFARGRVGFDGSGLSGKIDPTLDFVATSMTAAITASINVGGYASAPKITFTSVPDLPQSEVLAYLLFKRSAQELGPLQLAQIAAAIAQLTGVGGGADPLGRVQRGLGLDRLSVSSGSGATTGTSRGPAVEGGRYVAPGVYIGAKQGLSGNQTAAQVQIDLAPGLKAQTEVGTGAGGSSVGLSYEFEY